VEEETIKHTGAGGDYYEMGAVEPNKDQSSSGVFLERYA
jgi:hypothetical protein